MYCTLLYDSPAVARMILGEVSYHVGVSDCGSEAGDLGGLGLALLERARDTVQGLHCFLITVVGSERRQED